MTDLERIEELMSLYALGVLEGDELKEAENLISTGSPEALNMLSEYKEVVSMMSYSTSGVTPDPSLKKKLISDLKLAHDKHSASAVKVEPGSFWDRISGAWIGLGGAVAAAAIVALVVTNISLRNDLNETENMVAELELQVSEQELMLSQIETELAQNEELVNFLHDPDVVIVKLSDTHPVHNAGGRVHWDKDDNEALFVSYNLPETPAGKQYHWWVVADDTPKTAGVFKVGPDGTSLIRIGSLSDFGNIQKFILTMESEGGAERPSEVALLTGGSI